MKKTLLTGLLLIMLTSNAIVNAQSGLSIDASQLYTSFSFKDSQSNSLNKDYSGIFTGAYNVGYRYALDNGMMFKAGIGMRKGGATLVYDNMNYKWDLQYAVLKLGVGYILKKDNVSPYLNISGYYAYMLTGYQTLNNEDFDIKYLKSMQETDYGVYFSPGIEITLSDAISSYVQFDYIMGLQNLEKEEAQKSSDFAYGLTLGLSFSFIK